MLKFYHAPWSRASGVLWLLEELGIDYEMNQVDIRGEAGAPESYRAIQPSKKVPAIEHAPEIGDPARGPYLTMNVYCDAVLDPCVAGRAHGLEYVSNDYSFGLFDDMVNYVERVLTEHPYAAGDRFTAADTQLGSAVHYTMDMLKVLPRRKAFEDYVARIAARPAFQAAQVKDQDMAMKLPFFQKQFGGPEV